MIVLRKSTVGPVHRERPSSENLHRMLDSRMRFYSSKVTATDDRRPVGKLPLLRTDVTEARRSAATRLLLHVTRHIDGTSERSSSNKKLRQRPAIRFADTVDQRR